MHRIITLLFCATLLAPGFSLAIGEGNAICLSAQAQEALRKGIKTFPCPEPAPGGGVIQGVCVEVGVCKAISAPGLDGKGSPVDTALGGLMKVLEGILGKLGQGGGGGGSGTEGGSSPITNSTTTFGGTFQDISKVITTVTTAPRTPSTLDTILNSVFTNTNGTVASTAPAGTTVTPVGHTPPSVSNSTSTPLVQQAPATPVARSPVSSTSPAVSGVRTTPQIPLERTEVREEGGAATLEAGVRIPTTNTEVGGFYGGNTLGQGGGSQNAVGKLCATRPWATGLFARLIGANFFDNLCTRWGYVPGTTPLVERPKAPVDITKAERSAVAKATTTASASGVGMQCPSVVRVGQSAQLSFSCGQGQKLTGVSGFTAQNADVNAVQVSPKETTTYAIRCSDSAVHTCTVRTVDPRLSLWAEPKSVRLGTRTTVYWNTKDVLPDTCTVRGPSFFERGGRGGAATVPLNDESVFTLTCVGLDGATTTVNTTIDLAL